MKHMPQNTLQKQKIVFKKKKIILKKTQISFKILNSILKVTVIIFNLMADILKISVDKCKKKFCFLHLILCFM
jgi:hypothetical protein